MMVLGACGAKKNDGSWGINTSEILTKLIKEAAKCKKFSSDLFIDWMYVEKFLESGQDNDLELFFGFRDMGVDHKEYIIQSCDKKRYRAIYKLSLIVDGFDLLMTLEKVEEAK